MKELRIVVKVARREAILKRKRSISSFRIVRDMTKTICLCKAGKEPNTVSLKMLQGQLFRKSIEKRNIPQIIDYY